MLVLSEGSLFSLFGRNVQVVDYTCHALKDSAFLYPLIAITTVLPVYILSYFLTSLQYEISYLPSSAVVSRIISVYLRNNYMYHLHYDTSPRSLQLATFFAFRQYFLNVAKTVFATDNIEALPVLPKYINVHWGWLLLSLYQIAIEILTTVI